MISKLNLRVPLFKLFLFLIPTQLAYHFWPSFAFIYGFRVDYLAPAVYLTDLLILVIVISFIGNNFRLLVKSAIKNKIWLLFILGISVGNIAFAFNPLLAFIKWVKVLELTLLAYCLYHEKNLKRDGLQATLFWSSVFFSLLGIVQFFSGKTLGLYLLGERAFTQSTPGIALTAISGIEHLRGYSTFGHPNAAAGYFGALILWTIYTKGFYNLLLRKIGLVILISGFVVTFSRGAFLSFLLVPFIHFFLKGQGKSILVYLAALGSLLFVYIVDRFPFEFLLKGKEIEERINLAKASMEISGGNLFTGVGLNNFIPSLNSFNETVKNIWLLQPVHNIFLLILSEVGVVVTSLLVVVFSRLVLKNNTLGVVFLFIVFTGFFDHYWLTLQQNLLLWAVLIAVSLKKTVSAA